MFDNVTLLRAERFRTVKQARALVDDAGRVPKADKATFDTLMARSRQLKTEIEASERATVSGRLGGPIIDPTEQRTTETQDHEHRSAFVSYLRHGLNQMPQEQRSFLEGNFRARLEQRDMGTGGEGAYPGATSGFFVPVGFVNSIIEALKFTGPFLVPGVCELMVTDTGAPLPYPSDNDISILGERVGEGQQVTDVDVNLGMVMYGSYKYSTRVVKVSLELMQDSAFDMEAFLIRKFSQRLGRILNSDFTNGLGSASSQPMGLITSTLANGNLVAAVGSASNDGSAAGPNTIGSDDLIALSHAVDVLYRPNGSYMAHDSTWKKFKQVKDKFGRPLWQASLVPGAPDTFNGYPMLTNNYMDVLQVSPSSPPVTRNSVLFGDMRRYLIRRVKDLSVLRLSERWADLGQVGFLGFARYDAQPMQAGTGAAFPFALLQNVF